MAPLIKYNTMFCPVYWKLYKKSRADICTAKLTVIKTVKVVTELDIL